MSVPTGRERVKGEKIKLLHCSIVSNETIKQLNNWGNAKKYS